MAQYSDPQELLRNALEKEAAAERAAREARTQAERQRQEREAASWRAEQEKYQNYINGLKK